MGGCPLKKSQCPLLVNNQIITDLRFLICKRTGLKARFQLSKQKFNPIIWAQDIEWIVLKFHYPTQTVNSYNFLVNILAKKMELNFCLHFWNSGFKLVLFHINNLLTLKCYFRPKGGIKIFCRGPTPYLKVNLSDF